VPRAPQLRPNANSPYFDLKPRVPWLVMCSSILDTDFVFHEFGPGIRQMVKGFHRDFGSTIGSDAGMNAKGRPEGESLAPSLDRASVSNGDCWHWVTSPRLKEQTTA
jgi:hypothetical protein